MRLYHIVVGSYCSSLFRYSTMFLKITSILRECIRKSFADWILFINIEFCSMFFFAPIFAPQWWPLWQWPIVPQKLTKLAIVLKFVPAKLHRFAVSLRMALRRPFPKFVYSRNTLANNAWVSVCIRRTCALDVGDVQWVCFVLCTRETCQIALFCIGELHTGRRRSVRYHPNAVGRVHRMNKL